jgi:hypothetical protein
MRKGNLIASSPFASFGQVMKVQFTFVLTISTTQLRMS